MGHTEGGTSIESEFDSEGKYKVISIGSYSEESDYVDQGIRAIESEKTLRRVLQKNDLTMILNDKTSSGKIIGRVLFIDRSDVFVYNQRTEMIRGYEDRYYPKFLYHLLNAPIQRKKIVKQSQGNTQIYVNWSKVSETQYMIPEVGEQTIISNYFSYFDHLISLHQRKLEMLKKIKKSMLEKMFPKNDAKVPELRFSDFTDAWEQKELGELFSYLQNNTLSRAELNDNYGVAQSIHYGDVLIKYGECLDVSKERLAFIEKQSIADKFKTAYLQDGDIIVADTAEDGTVGKCTEIQDLTDKKIISGLHTIPLRPDQKFASGYLGFYMNSNSYHDQLKPLMQGIKVTSISKSAIQNTVVRYPFSLKEQGLVSRYLCLLNTLISLHQRKLEKLKNIKKSMLEKMFII